LRHSRRPARDECVPAHTDAGPTGGRVAEPLGFDDHFERAEVNIFRLETLQCYGNSGENPALAAFEAGEPRLITSGKREWVALIGDRTAAGCTMQRVHVVSEPISTYLQFELTWSYQPNVAAGEDIGIVPVPPGDPRHSGLPERTDFWLFDFSAEADISAWVAAGGANESVSAELLRRNGGPPWFPAWCKPPHMPGNCSSGRADRPSSTPAMSTPMRWRPDGSDARESFTSRAGE